MSNSSLVNFIQISPNKHSPRRHAIDTITIHCVVGQASVEGLGDLFGRTERQASSNYGIGFDGRIGMYCEEKDRSWCSSSADNDNRAITIECASDTFAPYAINDKVWNSLINLCADICFRNKIPKLLWKGDKNLIGKVDKQNITVHRWFAVTECPGDYIYDRLGQIADEVNAKLDVLNGVKKKTVTELAQEVIAGKWGVDPERTKKLKAAGYDAAAVQKEVDALMGKKPVAETPKKTNMAIAEEVVAGKWGVEPERSEKLKAAGYDPAVVQKGVNALMGVSNAKKSNMEIAEEVVAGKWGTEPERTKKLTEAGYDAKLVQKGVNALMGISNAKETTTTPAKKTNFEIAQEVIAGKWGVDPDRTKKLKAAGYDATAVQKEVDALMGKNAALTKAVSEVKAKGYAEKFNPAISNTYTVKTALNMRDKASTSSKVLVVAPKGTKVQCFGYYTYAGGVNWYYVTATIGSTKYTGFMDSTYFN